MPGRYRFLKMPVVAIPPRIERRLVRELEREGLWEGMFEWCRLVEDSTDQPVDISIRLICLDWHLVGFAILQKIALRPTMLLRSRIPLPGWLDRTLSVTLGILDLPFQCTGGFLLFGEQARKNTSKLLRTFVREVRRSEQLNVILVNAATQTPLEEALQSLSFVRSIQNYRSYIDNSYINYTDYVEKQSKKKRKTIRQIGSVFARGNISVQMVEDPTVLNETLESLVRLYHCVTSRKRRYNPVTLSDDYFIKLIRRETLRPFFMLYRQGEKLVGFSTHIRSKRQLFVKQVGMEPAVNAAFKIYHQMMYNSLQYGFDNGYSRVDCGVAKNSFKEVILKCSFVETYHWVKAWGICWFGLPVLRTIGVLNGCKNWIVRVARRLWWRSLVSRLSHP